MRSQPRTDAASIRAGGVSTEQPKGRLTGLVS